MAQLKDTQITGDLVVIKDGVEVNIVDVLNELKNTTAKAGAYIVLEKTVDTTNYSSSYNGFSPFQTSDCNVTFQKGNLSLDSVVLDNMLDRTNYTVYGIRVGADINVVKVAANVTYVSKGSNVTIRNYIARYRPSDGTRTTFGSFTHQFRGADTERETFSHSTIFDVQEDDFIWVYSYKFTASADIDVYADYHGTQLIVEAID